MVEQISNLFESYSEPVVGCKGDKIAFMNSAAVAMFSGTPDNLSPEDCFPSEVLSQDGRDALAAFERAGCHITVSISHMDNMKIFRVMSSGSAAQDGTDTFLDNIGGQMREALAVLNVSASRLSPVIENTGEENLTKHMSMIYHSYYKLLRLSGNITSYNQLSAGTLSFRMKNTDIIELIRNLIASVRPFAKRMNIALRLDSDAESLIMSVDPPQIERMLLNLLSNAIKHTGDGGEVVVSLRVKRDRLTLSVRDTGIGIPPELLTTSFDKYAYEREYTDTWRGTGLGFSLARYIVAGHGGTLLLESIRDKGTTVTVSIPIKEDKGGFRDDIVPYHPNSMSMIFTELSDVLSYQDYMPALMD